MPAQDDRPHAATMLAIVLSVLGIGGAVLGFLAMEDRKKIKDTAETALSKATEVDKEVAILRTELATMRGLLRNIEAGQEKILDRLPARR